MYITHILTLILYAYFCLLSPSSPDTASNSRKRSRTAVHPTHHPHPQRFRHNSATTATARRHQAVLINAYTEPSDHELLRWQEIQVSRCIIENSVNTVVEAYTHISTSDSDVSESETTEDAGIQAAISNHGLSIVSPLRCMQNFILESPALQAARDVNFLSVVSGDFPVHSDDDEDADGEDNDDDVEEEDFDEMVDSSDEEEEPYVRSAAHVAEATASAAIVLAAAAAVVAAENAADREREEREREEREEAERASTPEMDAAQNASREDAAEGAEHLDFMEAAVAVAIREKGLVTTAPDVPVDDSPDR